jgi:beta-xylosidase
MLKNPFRLFRYLFRHTKWRIGVARSSPSEILKRGLDACLFKWLEFNNSAINADPFILHRNGNYYIFYEDLDYKTNLKNIRWIRIDDNLDPIEHGKANGLPSYASYPLLLNHKNEIYCIPEAHKENNISLYVATLFPGQWEKVCTLIDEVKGVDPTIFYHAEKWWLFYSDKDDSPDEKLLLSFSKDLSGPYRSHPNNPIVIDRSSARPAGNLFQLDGTLFRLGQDCSNKYGGAVVVNKIVAMDETVYREQKSAILRCLNQWKYTAGFHTLTFCEGMVAVDAKSINFSYATFLKRLTSIPAKQVIAK